MTAFHCQKCPKHGNIEEGGCPAWWEVIEKNEAMGQERLTKACGWALMPRFMTEVMRFSDKAAQTMVNVREEVLARIEEVRNEQSIHFAGRVIHLSNLRRGLDSGRISSPPVLESGDGSVGEAGGFGGELEPSDRGDNDRPPECLLPRSLT